MANKKDSRTIQKGRPSKQQEPNQAAQCQQQQQANKQRRQQQAATAPAESQTGPAKVKFQRVLLVRSIIEQCETQEKKEVKKTMNI